jgi:hypothetical protein
MKAGIEKRLQELLKRDGGLTPDAVIEEAKDPDSPLHDEFDWDVESAAMDWWREQARKLIRSVHVEIVTGTLSIMVPRYIRDPASETKDQGYRETAKIRSNDEHARAALAYELDRLEASIKCVQSIAVGLGLEEDAESMMRTLVGMRKKARHAT